MLRSAERAIHISLLLLGGRNLSLNALGSKSAFRDRGPKSPLCAAESRIVMVSPNGRNKAYDAPCNERASACISTVSRLGDAVVVMRDSSRTATAWQSYVHVDVDT